MENIMLIEKAIEFIQKNSQENLSLQSIADNVGFSLNYFDAIFKKYTGYSPIEYSRIYKLTRSALALRKTDHTILDIAIEFGYSTPENYTRAFKSFYGITPSNYREKYANTPLTVKDYSSRVAIENFKRRYPELREVDTDIALDYLFTHNPILHGENVVGITVADTAVLTLGCTDELEHFVYVSDYNSPIASVDIVCSNESDAILYLKLLAKGQVKNFSIRTSPDGVWDDFKMTAAQYGYDYSESYDMVYLGNMNDISTSPDVEIRELYSEDMWFVRQFRQKGGCLDCHVRGLQAHFDNKGNEGERAFGLFHKGELVCLATPVLDSVREMKKYDIGALFAIEKGTAIELIEALWKYVINICIKDGAVLGNASADNDGIVSVSGSEKVGMVKVAKCCRFTKQ